MQNNRYGATASTQVQQVNLQSGDHTSKRSGTTGGTSSQVLSMVGVNNPVNQSVYSTGKGLGMENEEQARNNNGRSLSKIQKAEKIRAQANTSMAIQSKADSDNYNEVVDNRRRNLTSLQENLSISQDQGAKIGAIHATENKKQSTKLVSNRQKRVPTSGSQYVINPGGNHTASGRLNTRDIVPNSQKNERDLQDLHTSNLTDSHEDIVTLLPPGQYFKEQKVKMSEVILELETKMNKQLLEIGGEEQDYQRSKQKELTSVQEAEKKLKEKGEKLTYDQQKEKQNKDFLLKHHDILHKDQIHSKKLEMYSHILAQIAQ